MAAAPDISADAPAFDAAEIKRQFPALGQQVYDRDLVYLDNAATTQKPQAVLDKLQHYYARDNANIHRGIHALAERATADYEQTRQRTARWIGAASERQIVFTRGTTESINLVAASWGEANLSAGDEVLITGLEHHSNIVPWQMICQKTGATLRVAPINDRGEVTFETFEKHLSDKTRLVACAHISNALGTVLPVRRFIEAAHHVGAVVLVDGAQAVAHQQIDVTALAADFYAFSAHKMFGPTGVGVLYGTEELLEKMPPYQGGGDMIRSVTFEKTEWNDLPYKFEAGTPNIAGVIGLGAAIEWLESIDFDRVAAHETDLLRRGTELLEAQEGVRLIGTAADKSAVLSFSLEGIHPYDAAPILDRCGVAVRSGHHCAQPVMDRFGLPATLRASLAMYNLSEDLDRLIDGLQKVRRML
ncbi:MAG: cysteine desulfurase [Phycisphaeraceae bacterium]|nr:cysteine desulfurase [Phycisphaeraceae bacterium]